MQFIKKHTKFVLLVLALLLLMFPLFTSAYSRYITNLSAVFKTEVIALGKVEISIAETKVNEYGIPLTGADAGVTSIGQHYKLLPGNSYIKDPVITVEKGSNPCWIFVKVQNGIAVFEDETNTIFSQLNENGWTPLAGEPDVFYHDIVDAFDEEQQIPVFGKFVISGNANNIKGWDALVEHPVSVIVSAYAIQADGFDNRRKQVRKMPPQLGLRLGLKQAEQNYKFKECRL